MVTGRAGSSMHHGLRSCYCNGSRSPRVLEQYTLSSSFVWSLSSLPSALSTLALLCIDSVSINTQAHMSPPLRCVLAAQPHTTTI
jgi:hypothetical protein